MNTINIKTLISTSPSYALAGGACVVKIEEAVMASIQSPEWIAAAGPADLQDADWVINNCRVGETVMIITEGLKQALTENQLRAIIMHEHGHIFHGHMDNVSEDTIEEVMGVKIMNDMEKELEADRYALQFVSKKDLITAMKKAVIYGIKEVLNNMSLVQKIFAPAEEAALKEAMKQLRPRLVAIAKA